MRPARVVSWSLIVLLLILCVQVHCALGAQVQLAWDKANDTSVIGYRIYYGTSSRNYSNNQDVQGQDNITYLLTGLTETQPLYFALTARSAVLESDYSDEIICYTIRVSSPTNGQIIPAGNRVLLENSSNTYLIEPNTGYRVADVLVDGVSVGAVTEYSFNNLSACHGISANIVPSTYSVAANALVGGSISPSGSLTLNYGASQTFYITPDTGYHIVDVVVNGISLGPVSSYTLANITSSLTISAIFAENLDFSPILLLLD